MPEPIAFGGTNGVGLLDMGQYGGAFDDGSTINIVDDGLQEAVDEYAMPGRSFVAVKRLGTRVRMITCAGFLRTPNHGEMNELITTIESFYTDIPTQLKNNITGEVWANTVLRELRRTDRRFIDAHNNVIQPVSLKFEVLA